jgi:hypothetical protein
MAEFAGYIGSQVPPTDWSKITRDYTDKLISLNEQRKAEQEKIDDMEAEAYAKVGDIESTSSEPFNNFMLDTVDNYRQAIAMQAKLVKQGLKSQKDFKKTLLTATTQTGVLNRFAKTYQEQAAMLTKAAAEGKLGKYGLKMAQKFGSLQNIGNRKSYIDPDTAGLFIADIDPQTKTIKSKNNISSILTIANPANSYIPMVDLSSTAKGVKELLATKDLLVLGEDGSSYVSESAKNNPDYKTIIDSQAASQTATPNQIVNVLSDYGGYETYFNEDEKKELLSKGYKEDKLIFVGQRNNLFVPEIDDTQKQIARDIVAQNLNSALSEKIKNYKAAPAPKELTGDEKKLRATYAVAKEGWADLLEKGRRSEFKDDILQMSGNLNFANGDVVPIVDNGKITGVKIYSNDGRAIKELRSQEDFYDFINYNPLKPIESKISRKMAEEQLGVKKMSSSDVILNAKQQGVDPETYKNYLISIGYTINK